MYLGVVHMNAGVDHVHVHARARKPSVVVLAVQRTVRLTTVQTHHKDRVQATHSGLQVVGRMLEGVRMGE